MSELDLTKPQLFSIYNSSELESENDINELYSNLNENIKKSNSNNEFIPHNNTSISLKFVKILLKSLLLSFLGIGYHQLSYYIKLSKPLEFSYNHKNNYIYSIEGLLFGSLLPLLDYLFKLNPSNKDDKIRSLVALLGITFGLKKIEWNDSIQPIVIYSLLNPLIWYLLDSSLSGLFYGAVLSLLISLQNDDWNYDKLLLIGNFYFSGIIVFGKIGRYLYSNQ